MQQEITLTAKQRHSGAGIAAAIKTAVAVLFGEHISTVITALALVAMFWHLLTIDDALLQGRRVAIDVACALPWIAALIFSGKGGQR